MFAVLWSTLLVILREAGRTNLLDIPFHPPVWSSAFALNSCSSYPGMQNYMFRAGCRTSNEPPLLTLEVRTSSAEQLTRVVMLSLSPILVHGALEGSHVSFRNILCSLQTQGFLTLHKVIECVKQNMTSDERLQFPSEYLLVLKKNVSQCN